MGWTNSRLAVAGFFAGFVATIATAEAQGKRSATSFCDDANHPPAFLVAGNYFHIHRDHKDIDDARFHIVVASTNKAVAIAKAKPKFAYEAEVEWKYCSEKLRVESIPGGRFTVALDIEFDPGRDMLNQGGRRVIRRPTPIVEAQQRANLSNRSLAFRTLVGTSLSNDPIIPGNLDTLVSYVDAFDRADALLADSERSVRQYRQIALQMSTLAIAARGRSEYVPASWAVRFRDFSSDPKFSQLRPIEQSRLNRTLAAAAAAIVRGASESDRNHEDFTLLQRIAASVVTEASPDIMLKRLAGDPRNLNEMWNLTKENSIALIAISGGNTGALDLYTEFFVSAPIDHESISAEARRRIAIQSSVYYGQYLDEYTGRAKMQLQEYITSVRSDERKVVYWIAYGQWLKKHEAYFSGGSTNEAKLLKTNLGIADMVARDRSAR